MVSGVMEDIVDEVEDVEALSSWARLGGCREGWRQGGEVFPEQDDAGATWAHVFEDPTLAVLSVREKGKHRKAALVLI